MVSAVLFRSFRFDVSPFSTCQYFVRLQKTLTAFKAICSIKSLINDKKAERLAKRMER